MKRIAPVVETDKTRISLASCPKAYSQDQDKAVSPQSTVARVKERLAGLPFSVLAETRRIDNGRLGIPVYLSVCGEDAKRHMPTRKQMGKGASPEQAEASALMELMERYGFFTYWENPPDAVRASWTKAEQLFPGKLMPLEEIVAACHDDIDITSARRIMNLREWLFAPALRIADEREVFVPIDLFKQLGEFNGSSAGNTDAESIFQGACELVERHVCCLAEHGPQALPTIDLSEESLVDPVLVELAAKFQAEGIRFLLKDFSLGIPVPTVAALAYDPSTFPHSSEIVFTAGTASSPAKAAIRALTEVAQLAGDFNNHACYEASGLPKYAQLSEAAWLFQGPAKPLHELPSIERDDILDELKQLALDLHEKGFTLYSVSTVNPDTAVPTHYSIVPGFHFRERDNNASLGLFVGRLISEEAEPDYAEAAFALLGEVYPNAHFVPFFRGMVALREEALESARTFFAEAVAVQPDDDSRALAAFYLAYAYSLENDWPAALPHLDAAARLCPDMKEYLNFRGVCLFRMERFAEAAHDFADIITRLDKGSAMDLQNLGLCYKRLGETSKAVHYLSAALALDPGLEKARAELESIAEKPGAVV